MAVRRGGLSVAVADEQDVHRNDVRREGELLADSIGIEGADPQRVESLGRCGEHHMVGDDRGVDVRDPFAVVFAGPDLLGVGADDECARSPEVPRAADEPFEPLGRADDDDALRLPVGTRGSDAPRFEDICEFFRFDRSFLISAAGVPRLRQREKIHVRKD